MSEASSSPRVTTYAETAALYAVLNGDLPGARRIVGDLLPGEREEFAAQLTTLLDMLGPRCEECGALTPAAQGALVNPLSPQRRYVCRACTPPTTEEKK